MKLKWLGTAAFQVETAGGRLLIDPYLSRNAKARPTQTLRPVDIAEAGHIFITHGHFDHLYDVPAIMALGRAEVYCSQGAAGTLVREGVEPGRIHAVEHDGCCFDLPGVHAQAFFSRHVKFDIPLVARTLWQIGSDIGRLSALNRAYPAGQVLSWRFSIDGYTIHHFGSAGSSREELARLAKERLDLLLIPLQGHSKICDIAFDYVRMLRPRLVMPHHQDDFYPPVSTAVDIEPFINKVRKQCPETEVRAPAINEIISP